MIMSLTYNSKVNNLLNSSLFNYYSFNRRKAEKCVCERRIKDVKDVTTLLTFRLDRTRASHVGNLLLATLPPLYYLYLSTQTTLKCTALSCGVQTECFIE